MYSASFGFYRLSKVIWMSLHHCIFISVLYLLNDVCNQCFIFFPCCVDYLILLVGVLKMKNFQFYKAFQFLFVEEASGIVFQISFPTLKPQNFSHDDL